MTESCSVEVIGSTVPAAGAADAEATSFAVWNADDSIVGSMIEPSTISFCIPQASASA